MTRKQAEGLLTIDFQVMNINDLQKYHVKLLDAWRESRAEYGETQAIKNGFYAVLSSESASGYMPVNLWLTQNLLTRLNNVESKLNHYYNTNE